MGPNSMLTDKLTLQRSRDLCLSSFQFEQEEDTSDLAQASPEASTAAASSSLREGK